MRCLYCDKPLTLFRRLALKGFCSQTHKEQYLDEYRNLVLNRLIDARFEDHGDPDRRRGTRTAPQTTTENPEPDAPPMSAAPLPLAAVPWHNFRAPDRKPNWQWLPWPGRGVLLPVLTAEPEGAGAESAGNPDARRALGADGEAAIARGPAEESPADWVAEMGRPLVVRDAANETRWPAVMEILRANNTATCYFLPLTAADRKLGALGVGYPAGRDIEPAELAYMERVAAHLAAALDSALKAETIREYEQQLRREREWRQALFEISSALASASPLEEILGWVLHCLRSIGPYEWAGLVLREAEAQFLVVRAFSAQNGSGALRIGMQLPLEGSLSGAAMISRKPIIVDRLAESPFKSPAVRLLVKEGLRSACSIPLIVRNRVLGAMTLASTRESAFFQDDITLLRQVAAEAAVLIENGRTSLEIELLRKRLDEESAGGPEMVVDPTGNGSANPEPPLLTKTARPKRSRTVGIAKAEGRPSGTRGPAGRSDVETVHKRTPQRKHPARAV